MSDQTITLRVNGTEHTLDAPGDIPLLWVLRDRLNLTGTKYGCGIGFCGACTVHVDGAATLSCVTPISNVHRKSVTTIEGLSPDNRHPLQVAWIAEQVPQCGYCQSGQIMRAAVLLARNSSPTRPEILQEMRANICRCGTYLRIIAAIERAAGQPELGFDRQSP
jgi:isoquinoline 1-oxidoreductase subunit alpha